MRAEVYEPVVRGQAATVRFQGWHVPGQGEYGEAVGNIEVELELDGVTVTPQNAITSVSGTNLFELELTAAETDAQRVVIRATSLNAPDVVIVPLSPSDLLSVSRTVYGAGGRVVETVANAGTSSELRTGTVYYDNGQVHYSGTLNANAPADWHEEQDPQALRAHFRVAGGRAMVTDYAYDQLDGTELYDAVTDARGLTVRSYRDELGRVVRVVRDNATPLTATTWRRGRSMAWPARRPQPDASLAARPFTRLPPASVLTASTPTIELPAQLIAAGAEERAALSDSRSCGCRSCFA